VRSFDEIWGQAHEATETEITLPLIPRGDEPPDTPQTAPFPASPAEIIVPGGMPMPFGTGIDPSRPMIALTFDDGPSIHTERILDLLDEYGGHATFFVIGQRVESGRAVIIRAHESGHEVLGHSQTHRNMNNLSMRELRREIVEPHEAIEAVIGSIPQIFRPPFGALNSRVRSVAAENDFMIFNWSLDTRDWRSRCPETIHEVIFNNVRDRDIILAHDIHGTTAAAMETVIPELVAQGYQLVTLSELMQHSEQVLEAGALYTHGRQNK
jgi:peptidoglycan/xylan/chitin deacetylase (PgdA/CDA1 family)